MKLYLFPAATRARVLEVARREIGNDDDQYFWDEVLGGGPPYPSAWCGAFALWVLQHAGITDRPWVIEKGFLLVEPKFPTTKDPKPGDVAYIHEPYQHHAIVESIDGDDVHLIAGNTPSDDVARQVYKRNRVVFYSIEPFLSPWPTVFRGGAIVGLIATAYLYFGRKGVRWSWKRLRG